MAQASKCQSCGAETNSSQEVQLWDGNNYCIECVQAASPELLAMARNGDPFSETFDRSALGIALLWTAWLEICASSIWVIFPLLSILGADVGFIESLQGWVLISVVVLPVAVLLSLGQAIAYAVNRPTTSVNAGYVQVTQRGKARKFRLLDCEWYLGRISHMDLMPSTAILRQPAVIIVLPPDEEQRIRKVAVGLSEQTREMWKSFLTLTNAPRRVDPTPVPLPKWLMTVLAFVAAPLGFVFFLIVGRLLTLVLLLFVPDRDVCAIVGGLVFVCGFMTACIYAIVLMPWRSTHLTPSRDTVDVQKERHWLFVGALLLTATGFIVVPLAISSDLSLAARIVGSALSYSWALIVGHDVGKRISRFERDLTKPVRHDAT